MTSSEEDGETIGRLVDWCFALDIRDDYNLQGLITRAFTYGAHHAQSLNQCINYISEDPLWLHVEIKKDHQARDPKVQLAIWALADLRKKMMHGWDTSMPVPGIVIDGVEWRLYLFFERGGNLVRLPSFHALHPPRLIQQIMLGPYEMGRTDKINGVYQIMFYLDQLIQWGLKDYRKWFYEVIPRWANEVIKEYEGGADP